MQRRELLSSLLWALCPWAAASGCASKPPSNGSSNPNAAPLASPLSRVGLQLYTVRTQLQQDPTGTLNAIAAMGYREVEFAGYFGIAPSDWRSILDGLGLTAPAGHFSLDVFQTSFESILDIALALGHRYVVLPFLPDAQRNVEGYQQVAALLNQAANQAAPSGIEVVYHNHDFDFAPLPESNTLGFDLLLSELDPAVRMELDTYWIEVAGKSALDYLQRVPNRFRLLHVKDVSETRAMADVGYGTLDWPSLIPAAQAAGVLHFLVEHDSTSDPLGSAERSFQYLTT